MTPPEEAPVPASEARAPLRLEPRAARALLGVLGFLPLIAAIAPRLLAFYPALAALALLLWGGGLRRRPWGKGGWADRRIFLPVLLIAGLALASCLWSVSPHYTFRKLLPASAVLAFTALLPALAALLPAETIRRHAGWLGGGLLLAACLAALEMGLGYPLQEMLLRLGRIDRISASHMNRSVVAVLLLAAPALPGLPKGALRFALAAALAAMVALTASQSSQMAFMVFLVFLLAFPYRCRAAWHGLAAILAAAILAAPFLAVWLFRAFSGEIGALPFLGQGAGFGAQRLEIWDFVARYALQRPWLGYGMVATRQIVDFDTRQLYFHHAMVLHPHNFALQLWIEFGLPGALLGAGMIVALLSFLRRRGVAAARVALPGFMAFLSISATGYGMWQGWWLGLALSACAFTIVFARLAEQRASIQEGASLRQ